MNKAQLLKKISRIKKSSQSLNSLKALQRKKIILDIAGRLEEKAWAILKANKQDIKRQKFLKKPFGFIERMTLNKEKIMDLSRSLKEIADMDDAVFSILEKRNRPSGIKIEKISVPLGVIAIIYESRPNVTVESFILCFKSANAVILKAGREITQTNKVFISLIKQVLKDNQVDPEIILDLSSIERFLVKELLKNQNIDCLIPRGGKGLIDFVKKEATVPVIETGASVVHTYVDSQANLDLAEKVILNSKTRRVSICNALDVLLLHQDIYKKALKKITSVLAEKKVQIRGDQLVFEFLEKLSYPDFKKASPGDFDREFLDYILAVKVVDNFDQALKHIQKHTLGHSEGLVTESKSKAEKFFDQIDAGCLYWNTSTQFSDGAQFGLGGEIGISTQKLHARGPFSFESLVTYKYLVKSRGALRK